MKYYLLSNSCVVCLDDKTYTISNDDYRYSKIRENLENGNFELVENIVDPNDNLDKEGFIIKNGLVHYEDQPIPSVLGNKFLEVQQNSWEFRSIFNFWYNLKSRLNREESANVISELIKRNAYAVTEDGFYFVYKNESTDISKNVLNKKLGNVFHFYNYSTCPNNYFAYFEDKKNINEILEDVFGFCSKKIRNLAISNLFEETNNYVNYKFFFYGEALKDVLNNDNILFAIENNLLDTKLGDVRSYSNLRQFLKDYSIEKNGQYSQKKVLNFLQGASNKQHLVDVGLYYHQLKETLNLDIQSIEFSNNCELIYNYLSEEVKKLKCPKFDLNTDMSILNLQDEVIENEFRILVPFTNYDLIEWSNIMQNCIGSYGNQVLSKESQIFAIMDNKTNEMLYNIEIQKRTIRQFSTRANKPPKKTDRSKILRFLMSKNIIIKE
jgi:hypothetical protein